MSDLRTASKELFSKLVDFYQGNQCVWKATSKDYLDRNLKKKLGVRAVDRLTLRNRPTKIVIKELIWSEVRSEKK
jgi:hypothetical protein